MFSASQVTNSEPSTPSTSIIIGVFANYLTEIQKADSNYFESKIRPSNSRSYKLQWKDASGRPQAKNYVLDAYTNHFHLLAAEALIKPFYDYFSIQKNNKKQLRFISLFYYLGFNDKEKNQLLTADFLDKKTSDDLQKLAEQEIAILRMDKEAFREVFKDFLETFPASLGLSKLLNLTMGLIAGATVVEFADKLNERIIANILLETRLDMLDYIDGLDDREVRLREAADPSQSLGRIFIQSSVFANQELVEQAKKVHEKINSLLVINEKEIEETIEKLEIKGKESIDDAAYTVKDIIEGRVIVNEQVLSIKFIEDRALSNCLDKIFDGRMEVPSDFLLSYVYIDEQDLFKTVLNFLEKAERYIEIVDLLTAKALAGNHKAAFVDACAKAVHKLVEEESVDFPAVTRIFDILYEFDRHIPSSSQSASVLDPGSKEAYLLMFKAALTKIQNVDDLFVFLKRYGSLIEAYPRLLKDPLRPLLFDVLGKILVFIAEKRTANSQFIEDNIVSAVNRKLLPIFTMLRSFIPDIPELLKKPNGLEIIKTLLGVIKYDVNFMSLTKFEFSCSRHEIPIFLDLIKKSRDGELAFLILRDFNNVLLRKYFYNFLYPGAEPKADVCEFSIFKEIEKEVSLKVIEYIDCLPDQEERQKYLRAAMDETTALGMACVMKHTYRFGSGFSYRVSQTVKESIEGILSLSPRKIKNPVSDILRIFSNLTESIIHSSKEASEIFAACINPAAVLKNLIDKVCSKDFVEDEKGRFIFWLLMQAGDKIDRDGFAKISGLRKILLKCIDDLPERVTYLSQAKDPTSILGKACVVHYTLFGDRVSALLQEEVQKMIKHIPTNSLFPEPPVLTADPRYSDPRSGL